ncbi:hypothetical protein CC86DRAFT_93258 [Ophiobolus disseminans]|uniref:Uncharacterized protein n=1 Tax=Ophiobolus disseminans TaxID=1469910 RepID=A0A6A7AIE2_9PLEO|nr:hypothetical protein CC86DRAFT_93258 [Ophiobolus disseminans]
MSRPKSMPDFSALMDASTPLFEARAQNRRQTSPVRGQGYPRKKLSISLAAGLIMNTDSPKVTGVPGSPRKSLDGMKEEPEDVSEGSLFHAYVLKSDISNSPPYILTFASAAICTRWWALVQREYPDATRPSPQLFVMKSEDVEHIHENLRFYSLRHKWFYTGQDNLSNTSPIIPLQSADGHALAPAQQSRPHTQMDRPSSSSSDSLADKLDRLTGVVEKNTEQIHALSVAQSAGLQRMQQINESNTAQIKALAESQAKLQALIDQNASHYIALSNSSFQAQESIKNIMKTTATQIQGLSRNQAQLANTYDGMMRGIDNLASSVSQININNSTMSDTSTAVSSPIPFSVMGNRINPPPRKLNRKIKGVWYEYDNTDSPTASPRRSVQFADTPTKTPVTSKNT